MALYVLLKGFNVFARLPGDLCLNGLLSEPGLILV